MFCPMCRDEYRSGFKHCATCDVALVASLDDPGPDVPALLMADATPDEALAVFCGFLTLDEARHARDDVRGAKLPADILIREAPGTTPAAPVQEEFWLRVRPKDFANVERLIGFEPAAPSGAEDTFGCSACGATVHSADDACPGCGLRFEE